MPAQFLVRATDGPGERTRGDIIAVTPLGSPRGRKEGLPTYVWIEAPSVDIGEARKRTAGLFEGEGDERRMIARRRFRFPEAVVAAAEAAGGTLEVPGLTAVRDRAVQP